MNQYGIMDAYPSPCQWDEIFHTPSYKELLTAPYYPSPEVSPCMNDNFYNGIGPTLVSSSLSPPESLYSYAGPMNMMMPTTTNNDMRMIAPLQEMDMELALPPLDLLDQFIQHHENILTSSKYCYPSSNVPMMVPSSPKSPSPTTAKSSKKAATRSSSATLPRQKRSHTSKKEANSKKNLPIQYNCQHPGCGKTFNRPYNLQSHMRTHTTDRPFGCTNCGRRFARQHDRNRHEKLHWGIKPYSCSQCHKSFARMDALNRHLKVENGCGVNGNDHGMQQPLGHQVMV